MLGHIHSDPGLCMGQYFWKLPVIIVHLKLKLFLCYMLSADKPGISNTINCDVLKRWLYSLTFIAASLCARPWEYKGEVPTGLVHKEGQTDITPCQVGPSLLPQ